MRIASFIAASVLLACAQGAQAADRPQGLIDQVSEHPIPLSDFARFWERWPLFTVRFKTDDREQRFLYADPKAWEAIREQRYPLPDGSVVAKIGTALEEDGLFPSSLVPGAVRRIQVMKRDPAHAKARDGWVYALYVNGRPQLSDEEADACHACHKLAAERDYIFAQGWAATSDRPGGTGSNRSAQSFFRETDLSAEPDAIREALRHYAYTGSRASLVVVASFLGSLHETTELVRAEALLSGKAAVWRDINAHEAVIAVPIRAGRQVCVGLTRISSSGNSPLTGVTHMPATGEYCRPTSSRPHRAGY